MKYISPDFLLSVRKCVAFKGKNRSGDGLRLANEKVGRVQIIMYFTQIRVL